MNKIAEKVSQDEIDQARNIDIHALAGEFAQLKGGSTDRRCGPCPKCGGKDRFVTKGPSGERPPLWHCQQCHSEWGDAVELIQWMYGLDFRSAIEHINGGIVGGTISKVTVEKKHEETETERERLEKWIRDAEDEMYSANENLFSRDDARGWLYLTSRGINEDTMMQFWVGYRSDVPLPGTKGTQTAPAIVLPWTHNKKTVALRYRFLEKQSYVDLEGVRHDDDRLVSKPKAHEFHAPFAGRLFGGLGMDAERQRWLVLVEGEINCMSIWQAAHHAGIDVLSYGSESAKMPRGLANFASGYATVLVWADKREVAERLMNEIPGAVGIQSPERDGKKVDANDMLRDGTLGLFLAVVRDVAARDDDERRWLLRALLHYSRMRELDTAMAELCVDLGNRLNEYVSLRETERGTWVSEEAEL